MKMFIAIILLVLPTFAFAEESVGVEQAASLVRQPGVEKCLSVVENNQQGVARFESITVVSMKLDAASSLGIYKLVGSNLYGDLLAGSWEILVEVYSSEVGQTYTCKIAKNQE